MRRICESRQKSRHETFLRSKPQSRPVPCLLLQHARARSNIPTDPDPFLPPRRYQAKNIQRADEKEQIDIQQQDKRRLEEEINQASVELRRGAEELRNEYRKVLNDFCEFASSPSLDAPTRLGCMLLIRLPGGGCSEQLPGQDCAAFAITDRG